MLKASNMRKAMVLTAILAAALSGAGPAAAQQQAPNPVAEGPAWQVVCPENQASCSLMQNLVAGEQRQRLLTVLLQRKPEGGHSLTIALPHGVHFPSGVTLQLDDGAERTLAVQTSDVNGAYAGTPVDAGMLTEMRTGQTLKVSFATGDGQRIIVPVMMRDFEAGLTRLQESTAESTSS